MKYAENEENFTFGFWPGDKSYPHAAFYSYFYPAPKAMETLKYYSSYMREFILDYHEVTSTPNPEETIMKFFNQTYKEGSALAGWDFKSLECEVPAIKK